MHRLTTARTRRGQEAARARRRRAILAVALTAAVIVCAESTTSATSRHGDGARRSPAAAATLTPTAAPTRAAEAARGPQGPRPAWSRQEPVAPRRDSRDTNLGAVAVYGRQAEAVWDIPDPHRPRTATFLRAATRNRIGQWGPRRTVAYVTGGYLRSYELALGPKGAALLVYTFTYLRDTSHFHADDVVVMEVHRSPDRAWSSPHQLDVGSADGKPTAVVDPSGTMVAVWTHSDVDTTTVASASLRDEVWSEAHTLGGQVWGDPVVAGNRLGAHAIAWPTGRGLAVAVGQPDGTWQPTHLVRSVIHYGEPHVAIDDRGRVLAIETRLDDEETVSHQHIAWARTRPDGTWTDTAYLDTRQGTVYETDLDLAMNARGRAFAAWCSSSGSARVARYRPGRGWTTPRHIIDAAAPRSMLAPDGTALTFSEFPFGRRGRLSWAYQRPGRPWQVSTVGVGPTGITDVAAGDWRTAILYTAPRLTARILRVPRSVSGSAR